MINVRHLYSIGARKTHLGTTGHKYGILAREKRELQSATSSISYLFHCERNRIKFSRPLSKHKKRRRTETETSSGKPMEVA